MRLWGDLKVMRYSRRKPPWSQSASRIGVKSGAKKQLSKFPHPYEFIFADRGDNDVGPLILTNPFRQSFHFVSLGAISAGFDSGSENIDRSFYGLQPEKILIKMNAETLNWRFAQ